MKLFLLILMQHVRFYFVGEEEQCYVFKRREQRKREIVDELRETASESRHE